MQAFLLTRETRACWSGALRDQTWIERLRDQKEKYGNLKYKY